jgi:Ca2+-binding RTX toxin-like protein
MLLLTLVAPSVLLLAGGVALAAVISCPTGPGGECRGTPEADQITGASAADTIYALAGNDSVLGGRGDDFIQGDEGNDRELSANQGQDEIHGGEGDDIDLDANARDDKIYGQAGKDLELDGDKGNDELHGGPGDDGGPPTSENIRLHALRGEGGENRLYGEDGAESINAQLRAGLGGAPERIFGGEGTTPSPRPTG